MAPAGPPVVTIADVDRPYADVFVPQARIARLAVGAPARSRVDGVARRVRRARSSTSAARTEFTPRYLFSERERAEPGGARARAHRRSAAAAARRACRPSCTSSAAPAAAPASGRRGASRSSRPTHLSRRFG